jgi:hypothetical protein
LSRWLDLKNQSQHLQYEQRDLDRLKKRNATSVGGVLLCCN